MLHTSQRCLNIHKIFHSFQRRLKTCRKELGEISKYFYIFIFLYFHIFIFLYLYFYVFIFLYFYIFIFLYFYVFIFLCFYISIFYFYIFIFLYFYVVMFLLVVTKKIRPTINFFRARFCLTPPLLPAVHIKKPLTTEAFSHV